MNQAEPQNGNYFPYAVRGEKTLAQAAMTTYKGKKYISYNLDDQNTTVPTDIYYMPKGASDGEKFRIIIQTRLSRIRTVSIRLQ